MRFGRVRAARVGRVIAAVGEELDVGAGEWVARANAELDGVALGERLGERDREAPVAARAALARPLADAEHFVVAEFDYVEVAGDVVEAGGEVAGPGALEVVVEQHAVAGDEVVVRPHAFAGSRTVGRNSRAAGRLLVGRQRLAVAVDVDDGLAVSLGLPDAHVVADGAPDGVVGGFEGPGHGGVGAAGGFALGGPFRAALRACFEPVEDLRVGGLRGEEDGEEDEDERAGGAHHGMG